MNWKTFVLLLAIAMNVSLPERSNGEDIKVETGRMNIEHRQNDSTYIDTGSLQLSVPRNRSRSSQYPSSNSSHSHKGCRGNSVVHQSNRQINQSGRASSHSSTSYYRCH